MGLVVDLAVAKTNKYASRESGDSAELIERPAGGFSVVVVDGQGSGRAAKHLSLLVISRAVSLLTEGVRDGAVARAAHDFLYAYREGKVSATLDILSVDLRSKSVLVTRNADGPMIVCRDRTCEAVKTGAVPIGIYPLTRPMVHQLPLGPGLQVILPTDGIVSAGARKGQSFDLCRFAGASLAGSESAQMVADLVLAEALRLDDGRPADDMTVVALTLREHGESTIVRRLAASLPLP